MPTSLIARARKPAIALATAAVLLVGLVPTVAAASVSVTTPYPSIAVAPVLGAMLYGIMPNDPSTLAGAGVFVVVIAAAATAIPALRATRVEPSVALRNE